MLDTISMAEMLKGEYRTAFEKADMYSTVTLEDEERNDEKIMNLYDLLLEAQKNGKPVEKIIGNDVEAFCKSYFKTEKKWYVSFFDGLHRILICVIGWTILEFVFFGEWKNWKTATTDITPYIGGLAAFGVLVFLFRSKVAKKVIFKSKIKPIIYYLCILLCFFGSVIFMCNTVGKFQVEVPIVWIFGICTVYEGLYFVVCTIFRYRTQGTLRKCTQEEQIWKREEKENKKAFNEEVYMESTNEMIAKAMAKRYERLNKYSLRKKNRELTFAEYARRIRKEEYWGNILVLAIYIVLCAGCIIGQMLAAGIVDGLVFAVVLIVVESLIYLWMKKLIDQGSRQRLAIIAICEERGINLSEFVQGLHDARVD